MSESKTFTLITPIDGVTELTIEEPSVAEISKLSEDTAKYGATRALVGLIAAQTKQPATIINRLKARDFKAIDRYLNSFFDEPPETSQT
jgi:hypothetical protein